MELLRLLGVVDNYIIKILTGAKPRVTQHVGNRPRLLLVGETRSVGTRATELRSNMTADKNPSAQSKQNSASRNLRFTALGVVLACAVICAYSALTPQAWSLSGLRSAACSKLAGTASTLFTSLGQRQGTKVGCQMTYDQLWWRGLRSKQGRKTWTARVVPCQDGFMI